MRNWLFALVLIFALPTLTEAATFWEETFENNLLPNWILSDGCTQQGGCNASIQTDQAFSGTRSLRSTYDYSTCGNYLLHNGCGNYYDRAHTSTDEVYTRVWMRFQNETTWAMKHWYHMQDPRQYPEVYFVNRPGDNRMIAEANVVNEICSETGFGPYDSCQYTQNITSVGFQMNQWYCVETHVKMNTPGQPNGILEMWINGTQTMGYYTRNWRGPNAVNGPNSNNFANTQFSFARQYTQHGSGTRWMDSFAVGNTRIGCTGGGSGGDTIPPSQVTGLVAIPGNGLVDLTYDVATDNSGFAPTYNIYRSTSAGGPFDFVANVPTTTARITGLTNGTIYYFRVESQDSASPPNVGTVSSTVSATPTAPAGGTTTVSITTSGRFAINGTETLLIGVSYFDAVRYRESDLTALQADGINLIRTTLDTPGASVFNSDGTFNVTNRNLVDALIASANAKGIVVMLSILHQESDLYLTTSQSRTDALVNAATRWCDDSNVLCEAVGSHNGDATFESHSTMTTLLAAMKAVCTACPMSYSGTDNISGGHLFTSQSSTTVSTTNVDAELASGINWLQWNDERTSGFETRATARAMALRTYLNSIGRQGMPLIAGEPAREGSGGLGTASAYLTYFTNLVDAGVAAVVFHTDAGFDLSSASFYAQLNDPVETTVVDTLVATLNTATTPRITGLTVTQTGATITSTGSLAACQMTTDIIPGGQVHTASTGQCATWTHTYQPGETWLCVKAIDSAGVINNNPNDYQCRTVSFPGDVTAPSAPTGIQIR